MNFSSPESFSNQQEYLSEIFRIISSRKHLIVISLISACLASYIALQFISERYISDAALLVTLGRENTEVPITVNRGGVYTTGVRQEEINSEIQLLLSRSLTESTIDAIGLDRFDFTPPPPETLFQTIKYHLKKTVRWGKKQLENLLISLSLRKALSDREKVILLVKRSLSIERLKESDVIKITIKLPSPQLCVDVIENLLTLYLEKRISLRQHSTIKQVFDSQTAKYKEKLTELENKRKEFRINLGINSITEQRNLLLARSTDLQHQIETTEYEYTILLQNISDDLKARLNYPTSQLDEHQVPNLSVDSLKSRLTELKLRHIQMSNSYSGQSDTMKTLLNETNEVTLLLGNGLKSRMVQLRKQHKDVDKELAILNQADSKAQELDRTIKITETNYLLYAKRQEDARISAELDDSQIANVLIISHPLPAIKPSSPKKILIMTLGTGLGLILGFALTFVLAYFDDTIYTPRDLSKVEGMIFLGSFRSHK